MIAKGERRKEINEEEDKEEGEGEGRVRRTDPYDVAERIGGKNFAARHPRSASVQYGHSRHTLTLSTTSSTASHSHILSLTEVPVMTSAQELIFT
jgi:hypothetical protein